MTDEMKPKLFALADAIGISLRIEADGLMVGTQKRTLDLFEGYSPTIITDVDWGCVDEFSQTAVAAGRIWGNLGFVCVVEERYGSRVSFFVIDRSKADDAPPLETDRWSRAKLYSWLADCCKAVYHRSMYDTVWEELEKGPQKLKDYVTFRDQNMPSSEAYRTVWGPV